MQGEGLPKESGRTTAAATHKNTANSPPSHDPHQLFVRLVSDRQFPHRDIALAVARLAIHALNVFSMDIKGVEMVARVVWDRARAAPTLR